MQVLTLLFLVLLSLSQGLLLGTSMSNMVKTLLTLHMRLGKPMSKSSVLSICRVIELIKCVQYTFHRKALTVAEYLVLIINHYELALLSNLETVSVSLFASLN